MIGLHLSSPQKFWDSLLAAIERPDLGFDVRFSSRADRVTNYQALCNVLASVFIGRPRTEWEARLQQHDVPHAPVYSFPEVLADPQIAHLGTFYTSTHPRLGTLRAVHGPLWCDRGREEPELLPPDLGEHTEQ